MGGSVDDFFGFDGHFVCQFHAAFFYILFEAGVQRQPGVGLAFSWNVACAASRVVLNEGFGPDVFNADGKDLSAFDKSSVGNAALSHDLLGGFGCLSAGPVQDFFNWNIDAAINITRGDAADSQQGNEQAGGIKRVAGFFIQGVLCALHAAVGG